MDQPGLSLWIRNLRERLGLNQSALAQALGVRQPTVSRWERDIDRPGAEALARLVDLAAGADLPPPAAGRAAAAVLRPPLVPVVGYVGAGAEVLPFDEYAPGEGMEQVEAPPSAERGVVAVRVRGESMFPIEDGWLVFYRRDHDGVPSFCNQRLCVVKVADGPTLLKKLRFAPDGYYLESWNAPTRFAAALEWAAPIIDIRPRV